MADRWRGSARAVEIVAVDEAVAVVVQLLVPEWPDYPVINLLIGWNTVARSAEKQCLTATSSCFGEHNVHAFR